MPTRPIIGVVYQKKMYGWFWRIEFGDVAILRGNYEYNSYKVARAVLKRFAKAFEINLDEIIKIDPYAE